MVPRQSMGAHFGLFWALVAKWLPERLWELILACSGLRWPNSSQKVLREALGTIGACSAGSYREACITLDEIDYMDLVGFLSNAGFG